jgi:hypothetical protein
MYLLTTAILLPSGSRRSKRRNYGALVYIGAVRGLIKELKFTVFGNVESTCDAVAGAYCAGNIDRLSQYINYTLIIIKSACPGKLKRSVSSNRSLIVTKAYSSIVKVSEVDNAFSVIRFIGVEWSNLLV